jgi:hypothetical protein
MESSTERYLVSYLLQRFESVLEIQFDEKNRTLFHNNCSIKIPEFNQSFNTPITILENDITCFRLNGPLKLTKIEENNENYQLNWDIIQEIYDHLTMEINETELTEKEKTSLFMPVLDLKIFHLYEKLKTILNWNYKLFNNNKKSFAICLSHDIDRTGDSKLYRLITYTFQALKQKRPKLIWNAFFGRNFDSNFEYILQRENEYNSKATWFILTRYGLRKNADYTLNDKEFKNAKLLIEQNNHEIGIHIPYMNISTNDLTKETEKLSEDDKLRMGLRMHHLRGDYPDITKIFSESKFWYDSTFGFNWVSGYRFGTSIPFKPIFQSPMKEEIIDIYEVPLNIMDIQVNNVDDFRKKITRLFKILSIVHGVCVINWHNNRFNTTKYGHIWKESFDIILEEGQKHGAWLCSISELLSETLDK